MPDILSVYKNAISRKYSLTSEQSFEILSIALILDKPFDEVFHEIWTGGSGDSGIDGVFIDEQTSSVRIFQAKTTTSLSENELLALETSFYDLFARDNPVGRKVNQKLKSRLEEYKDMTTKGCLLEPKLFFIYEGINSDPAKSSNEVLYKQFSAKKQPEYNIFDKNELIARASTLQRTHRGEVKFVFKPIETNIGYIGQGLYSFSIGDVRAANFRIKALDICLLMEEEIKINGSIDTLFTENIRGYLGHNKANKRILETLKTPERSPFFPFMNNGLTIICQSMSIPSGPQSAEYNVPTVNPVIVNGLQTSKIIYEVFKENPDILRDIFVTIKVYESRDKELTDLITEATNTQTAINYRDQMSNKLFNKWAHDYFASKGIKYVSKRGEIMQGNDLSKGLSDSVSNEIVIKFWFATYNRDPHTAKISKNSVLEEVFLATKDENQHLASLFSGSPDSVVYSQLYNAYLIYSTVVANRETNKDADGKDYILHADELISYGIFKKLESENKLENFSSEDVQAAYDFVESRVNQIVDGEKERRGDSYANTKYFKSEASIDDYNQITSS